MAERTFVDVKDKMNIEKKRIRINRIVLYIFQLAPTNNYLFLTGLTGFSGYSFYGFQFPDEIENTQSA